MPDAIGHVLAVLAVAVSWPSHALEIVYDSGRAVPIAPYLSDIVTGADEPDVLPGQAFPLTTLLRPGLLDQDSVAVFAGQWMTQSMFIIADDARSLKWLSFNKPVLERAAAVGLVVGAQSRTSFKALQQAAAPLLLAPNPSTSRWLEQRLIESGAAVYPLLVHTDGHAYQILPTARFGERP